MQMCSVRGGKKEEKNLHNRKILPFYTSDKVIKLLDNNWIVHPIIPKIYYRYI